MLLMVCHVSVWLALVIWVYMLLFHTLVCRFWLVDLALAGTTGSAAVQLAARWSQALMVGGGEGGMVVVREQELISKHKFVEHGSRVRIYRRTYK